MYVCMYVCMYVEYVCRVCMYVCMCIVCIVHTIGIRRLSLPSLTMLSLDWTCVTGAISLSTLRSSGMWH